MSVFACAIVYVRHTNIKVEGEEVTGETKKESAMRASKSIILSFFKKKKKTLLNGQ